MCKCKSFEQMQVHRASSPRKKKSGQLKKSVNKQVQVQHENLDSRKSKSIKKCKSNHQAHGQKASLSSKYKSPKQVHVQEKHKRKKEGRVMSSNRRKQGYIYRVSHHKSKFLPTLYRKMRLNRLPSLQAYQIPQWPRGAFN